MLNMNAGNTILVTGATGFVGRQVVRELARSGHRVRVLVRNSGNVAGFVRENDAEVAEGNILDTASLQRACQGVVAVVHLVGIIREKGKQTYARVHVEGTRNVLAAAQANGVTRLLHMSAAGTRPMAPSRYHQTKWEAEELVRSSGLKWTILRPSLIYGVGDHFVSILVQLMRPPLNFLTAGFLPGLGDEQTSLQPVSVQSVARAFQSALANPLAIGKTYELAGEELSLREMILIIAGALGLRPKVVEAQFPGSLAVALWYRLAGYRPVIVSLPMPLIKVAAGLMEVLSTLSPVNLDQILMLEENQQADSTTAREDLGFNPEKFSKAVRAALVKN